MNLKTTLIALLILLTPPLSPALSQPLPATVISTGDGDDVRVSHQGQIITIRLGCIDAPERAQQPWGTQAATRLKQLLPPGQPIQLRVINRDRYGRTVGEVFLGNQPVNRLLVQEGMAVVYPQYINGCKDTQSQYWQAQAQAKRQGLGVWNPGNPMPVMPWEFRRRRR